MKKTIISFISFILFILLINFSSALLLNIYNGDAKIFYIDQKCLIQEKENLYCNVLLDIFINQTGEKVFLDIQDGNIGKALFNQENINFYLVGDMGNSPDYLNFNLSNPSNIKFQKELINEGLRIKLNSSNFEEGRYYLFFNYTINNFVVKDAVYDTIFFNIDGISNETKIYRTIILPDNSVIDIGSMYNFKIMAILEDGRRIVFSDQLGTSILVYRDWDKEQKERNFRDKIIIFISFALAISFGFLFSDKKLSKRTKNCFISFGFLLLISCWILLEGVRGRLFLKFILLLSFIGMLFLGVLSYYSSSKDHKRSPHTPKELKDIWKLFIELKNKFLEYLHNMLRNCCG